LKEITLMMLKLDSLSIKQKISLGFFAIGSLIFAACIFFYISLINIDSANQQIKEADIPVEQLTTELQKYQLLIGKTTASAFNQVTSDELTTSLEQIKNQTQQYESGLSKLKKLTTENSFFTDLLLEADAAYTKNINASLKMIEQRQKMLKTKIILINALKETESIRIATGDSILNLDGIETDKEQLFDQIVGQAVATDNLIFRLAPLLKSLDQVDSIENLLIHKEDVTALFTEIDNMYEFIHRTAQGLNADELLNRFQTNLLNLKSMMVEPDMLYQYQTQIINSYKLSSENYQSFESSSKVLLTVLDKIQLKASEYFQEGQARINQQISRALNWLWIIAVAIIGLAIVISVYTSRAMLKPLNAVNKSLNRLASGDLSKDMKKRNDDEFGILIDNLNKVTSNLRNLLNEINNNIHLLEELAHDSNERSQTLAKNTEQQLVRAESVKGRVHEVYSSSETVVNEAMHSASLADEAAEQGHQITEISRLTHSSIEQLSTRLTESVNIMADLTTLSNNIGGILDTIVGVAEQTNLLALNAAIEAARAGEQGRGFAVVADEVRTLASRTQDSTDEINNMITSLQSNTKNAEEMITHGQKDVNLCVEQSQQLFDAILVHNDNPVRCFAHSDQGLKICRGRFFKNCMECCNHWFIDPFK